jgi:hypothetical protein
MAWSPPAHNAGIVWVSAPGDYATFNSNHTPDGTVKWIRNTPTPSRQWQDLKVRISGAKVEGYLNGKLYLEETLPAPVSGKIGVWSKANSVVYFDDYRVAPAPSGDFASRYSR